MDRKVPYTNTKQGQKEYHTQTLNMDRKLPYTNTKHVQKKYHTEHKHQTWTENYHTQTLNMDRKSNIRKH